MSTNVREFLQRVMPWPTDDEPGYINVHAKMRLPDGKTPWTGKPTRDVDQFLQIVHAMLGWQTPPDIFFCMSRQASTKTGKDGEPRAAKSQQNALALKGIWLDIDIKDKGFATLTAAVTALGQFTAKYRIPPPTALVASGGGLHAHWISDRCLTVDEWRPYAEGLKNAAIEFFDGKMDTGVIADCARVLRVPGTFNYKQDTPRVVKLLNMRDINYDFVANMAALLVISPTLPRATTPVLAGHPSTLFAGTAIESLSEGIGHTPLPPLDWTPLVKECGWFREALTTGGIDFSQGLWNLSTLAATFMENGHALAHRMARGHPGYAYGETEALWERKLVERQSGGLGWPSCKSIQGEGCTHCAGCPLLGSIKSPLNLARVPTSVPVQGPVSAGVAQPVANSASGTLPAGSSGNALVPLTDADLPPTYIIINGIIHKVVDIVKSGTAPETLQLPLFHSRLYNPWAQAHPDAINFVTSVDKGSYRDVNVQRSQMTAMELISVLYAKGVSTFVPNEKYVREFVVSWLAKLNDAAAANTNVPFGWHMDGDQCVGFSYGSILYKADGTRGPVGMIDPQLKEIYGPDGTRDPWMDALHMITAQQRPGLEVIVAAAFGAPLMFGTGEYSVLMSVFGESGAGKSSAARVSTAVWAKPILAKEVETATVKSVLHRLGQIKHLPYYWDEIKDEKAQGHAYDVLYVCTGGAEGSRLHANITQQAKGTWQTICGIFSNPSFGNYIIKRNPNTTAGLMRVFEWQELKPAKKAAGQIRQTNASRMLGELDANYGIIGMEYAEWLGTHRQEAYDLVVARSHEFEDAVFDPDRNTVDERFWIAFASAVTAGAEIANMVIGTDFNILAMKEFLVKKIQQQRLRSFEENMQGGSHDHTEMMLTGFLKAMTKNTLVTETASMTNATGKPDVIQIVRPPANGEPTQVQWIQGAGLLLVSKNELNRWLRQPDVNGDPRSMMEGLKQHFSAIVGKGTLGKGTVSRAGQEQVITLPVRKGSALWELMTNEPAIPEQYIGETPALALAAGSSDTAGLYANQDAPTAAPQ